MIMFLTVAYSVNICEISSGSLEGIDVTISMVRFSQFTSSITFNPQNRLPQYKVSCINPVRRSNSAHWPVLKAAEVDPAVFFCVAKA